MERIEPTYIMMPVRAINEFCVNCPELEIDVHTTEMWNHDYTTYISKNELNCKRCYSCSNLAGYIKQSFEEEAAEKKEAEKVPAKTTKATKTTKTRSTKKV